MNKFEPIAIIGEGCILPGCNSPDELWQMVAQNKVNISSAPQDDWRTEMNEVLTAIGSKDTDNRSWHDKGGYVKDFDTVFHPENFELESTYIKELDPVFQWSFYAAREALVSSGYLQSDILGSTGLVMGNLSYPSRSFSELFEQEILTSLFPESKQNAKKIHVSNRFMSGLPAILTARAIGAKGDAFAIDAACASSLYAINIACQKLQRGEQQMMLAGGVCAADQLFLHVGFTALRALSPSGQSRPFNLHADGLIPAEGAAFLVLKRLEDAVKDDDKILGVIRGIGLSNDGKSGGFLSPSKKGQVKCLNKAFEQSDTNPQDLSYIECHATGTSTGDAVELESISQIFGSAPQLTLSSLKANIGHTITASGAAGIIKVLHAFKHQLLPPNPNINPLTKQLKQANLQVLEEAQPWESNDKSRMAGISNFGFGGNNAHLILEEWNPQKTYPVVLRKKAVNKVAIIGVDIKTDRIKNVAEFWETLNGKKQPDLTDQSISFGIEDLSFPPNDLKQALSQQLYILKTVQQLLWQRPSVKAEETGVFIGMGTDADINRFGLRKRLHQLLENRGIQLSRETISRLEENISPVLKSAGVIGTMPNIPANRINSHYDFSGMGYTVSCEELSGIKALNIAIQSIENGELSTAIVGAVDMSREFVHEKAVSTISGYEIQPTDGAVAILLKDYDLAIEDGDEIWAVVEREKAKTCNYTFDSQLLIQLLGHSHAAMGLMAVATAALLTKEKCKIEAGSQKLSLIADQDFSYEVKVDSCFDVNETLAIKSPEAPITKNKQNTAHRQTKELIVTFPIHTPDIKIPAEMGLPEKNLQVAAINNPKNSTDSFPKLQMSKINEDEANAQIDAVALIQRQHEVMHEAHELYVKTQTEAQQQFTQLMNASMDQLMMVEDDASIPVDTCKVIVNERIPSLQLRPEEPNEANFPENTGYKQNVPKELSAVKQEISQRPQFSREELKILASGKISSVFGPLFARQDDFHIQVRMPEPPLLLCDRVTGIQGEPGTLGLGTIWTETDVKENSWYLHNNRMPPGIFIESGQADLLLISWLGIDFQNEGKRAYRLLGCELTFYGELPKPGDTLKFQIHVDGYAKSGDVTLFFFHYDCHIDGKLRISVREGQAGFFTKEELADSGGVIWEASEAEYSKNITRSLQKSTRKKSFTRDDVIAYTKADMKACFGEELAWTQTHTRTPRSQAGYQNLIQEVTLFDPVGGPGKLGYIKSVSQVSPDDWFFKGHFKNDECMPGTLMAEACLQAMAFFMVGTGLTTRKDGWRFESVTEQKYKFVCRGQATPSSKEISYEIFVSNIIEEPYPTVYAHVLATVDGTKAFLCENLGLRLIPDWPFETMPHLLEMVSDVSDDNAAVYDGFPCDLKSLLNCAVGRPSAAFGDKLKHYDGLIRSPRLPSPPYHFVSRISEINAIPGEFKGLPSIVAEYDISADEWYFDENAYPTMPHCVLAEAAMQPCGWFSTFVCQHEIKGKDLLFRNLDGYAVQRKEIQPEDHKIVTKVVLEDVSLLGEIIIIKFDVECLINGEKVYSLKTVFGFFDAESMKNQKGLNISPQEKSNFDLPHNLSVDLTTFPGFYFSESTACLPPSKLLMIDRVVSYYPEQGKYEKGYLKAEKIVVISDWFFKAHFFQDPVQPGSLGIEAMIQLVKFYMLENNLHKGFNNPRFEPVVLGKKIEWHFRGQVIPSNKLITIDINIIECVQEENSVFVVGEGRLWADGLKIYSAPKIGVRLVNDSTERDSSAVNSNTLNVLSDQMGLPVNTIRWERSQNKCLNLPFNLIQSVDDCIDNPDVGKLDMDLLESKWKGFALSEDLFSDLRKAMIARFVRRIVIQTPLEFNALYGKSVLYLANHQTGIESGLFLSLVNALNGVPCLAIAKSEHKKTWMGQLLALSKQKYGDNSPTSFLTIDRKKQTDVLKVLKEVTNIIKNKPNSLLVHVDGTRSIRSNDPVKQITTVLIDFALNLDIPIVPVRFCRGLPANGDVIMEFPIDFGKQDYYLGCPIFPDQLKPLSLKERSNYILDAMNSLLIPSFDSGVEKDLKFQKMVLSYQEKEKISFPKAVILNALKELENPSEQTSFILQNLRKKDRKPVRNDLERKILEFLAS